MIERQFVHQKVKEHQIQEYLASQLGKSGYSHTEIKRTPLGEKVIIFTTRPGIVVGKKGDNIKRLTMMLKKKFKMENPQIEIGEVNEPNLDVHFIADKIASTLERFGSKRFKSTGYRVLQDVINAGALGAEVVIAGKVPSARAKAWRFKAGYLKKSGDISESFVKRAYAYAQLKSGTVGIRVRIMTSDVKLPDKIIIKEEDKKIIVEEVQETKTPRRLPELPKAEPVEEKPQKKVEETKKDGTDKKE